jgi:transcriptional regulator with XRE-family HTH domain
MPEDILVQISARLREMRKDKNVTLQELAEEAGVTKSLVSQIENGRSIPSLPVLLNLIKALALDFNQFFKDIDLNNLADTTVVKRAAEYHHFEKENALGFLYRRILSTLVNDYHIDIVLLTLQVGAKRPMVTTDAMEYKYVLQGNVDYMIGDQCYSLSAGDSIFFDGMKPHVPQNTGNAAAEMLVVYLFKTPR